MLISKRLSLTNLGESEDACTSVYTHVLGEDRAIMLKERAISLTLSPLEGGKFGSTPFL